MKYKYKLSNAWVSKVSDMTEFANGGTQVSIKAIDGKTYHNILISNSSYIIAMRGYKDLPFALAEIVDIYQTDDDKNPKERGGWDYWDDWK